MFYPFNGEKNFFIFKNKKVGRAGRFGTKGLAITFVSADEKKILDDIQKRFVVQINELPETIDTSAYSKQKMK